MELLYRSASGVPPTMSGNSSWDHNSAHYRLYPGFSYVPRSLNEQMEAAASRARIAQAAAEASVDSATATHILSSAGRTRNPVAVEYYGDSTRNSVPLVRFCAVSFYVLFLLLFFE